MNIIDISHNLHTKIPVYPGNPKLQIKTVKGKTTQHSEIFLGSHTGTHVDAPRHVFRFGTGVDAMDLEKMVGQCRVLDLTHVKESITIRDLKRYNIKRGERIIVRTKNSKRGFDRFFSDYVYLDGDAAVYLGKIGISLFGIDYLSVKKRGSSDNRPHTELLKRRIVIFEGLNLARVKAGRYFFIGLPLKFEKLDGSPARAVLVPLSVSYKIKL